MAESSSPSSISYYNNNNYSEASFKKRKRLKRFAKTETEWGLIDHRHYVDPKILDLNMKNKPYDIKIHVFDHSEKRRIINAHRHVIEQFGQNRPMIRMLLEKDRIESEKLKLPKKTEYEFAGTYYESFVVLLHYVYHGTVDLNEIDTDCRIELALTAHKLRYTPLLTTIAERFRYDIILTLTLKNMEDVYRIAKVASDNILLKKCVDFMDNCVLNDKVLTLKEESENSAIIVLDKPRHINYIQFMLSNGEESDGRHNDICFIMEVSENGNDWIQIVDNEYIWNRSLQWFYFPERKIMMIRINCTATIDGYEPEKTLSPLVYESKSIYQRLLKYFHFVEIKRSAKDLKFDDRGLLMPKHDAIQYPLKGFKHYFPNNNVTYAMSIATEDEKQNNWYYHVIDDGNSMEFYLPQTCVLRAIRFQLYSNDQYDERTHDFSVRIKEGCDDEWKVIGTYYKRSKWQTIDFGQYETVRWISITGLIMQNTIDTEFAITHFECPPQVTHRRKR